MESLFFWKAWPTVYRSFFWGCLSLFLISLTFLWVSDFASPAPVINATHLQELDPLPITEHVFHRGITRITVSAIDYLIFEHVLGSSFHPNHTAGYIFLGLLCAAVILLLTVVTTLKKFWFFVGVAAFILLVGSLRLESIEVFGWSNQLFIVLVVLIYLIPAYFFAILRPATALTKRVSAFTVMTVAVALSIHFFSTSQQPFYHLSANGLMAGTIITVIFIFMQSHELLASFITLLTRGPEPTKSLKHFYIIAAIYLVNLAFIYANRKGMISWSPFPFSLFLLITLAAIIGIWGFRQREYQYRSIFRADPFGVIFYLGLAIIAFVTMGYFMATINDPAITFVEDAIIYAHLGYGIIFTTYVTANFFSLLGNNLHAHKVLYKPVVMPYFSFRLAGLIATFAFFAYSNYRVSLNQVFASYEIAMGDFYFSQNELDLAEGYYTRSILNDRNNYHGPYALTEIMGLKNQSQNSKDEYKYLVRGRGLVYASLNLSQICQSENSFTEAAGVLAQGLTTFPKNGYLQNALALSYSKLGMKDTALVLIEEARRSSMAHDIAETNLAGICAKFNHPFPVDSLAQRLDTDNEGTRSNLIALATVQGKSLPSMRVDLGDTALTDRAAATLNNFLLDPNKAIDTATISRTLLLARKPVNEPYNLFLFSAVAHACYRNGYTAQAFRLMREAAFRGQEAEYYTVLGLWSIEQGAFQNSIHYFDQATQLKATNSDRYRAIAFTENEDSLKAQNSWADVLKSATNPEIQRQVKRIVSRDRASRSQALAFSDEEKFEYARHHFPLTDETEFERFINTIRDDQFKARAILDRATMLEVHDETELAVQLFGLTKGLQIADRSLYDEIVHVSMRFLAKQKQWALLEKQLATGISFEGVYRLDKIYFEALLNEQKGRMEEAARTFKLLSTANPFYEDALLYSSDFIIRNGGNKLAAFSELGYAMDINPQSVKLLKAYIVQATYQEFDEDAQDAVDGLKKMISNKAFARFVAEHPEIFEITIIR